MDKSNGEQVEAEEVVLDDTDDESDSESSESFGESESAAAQVQVGTRAKHEILGDVTVKTLGRGTLHGSENVQVRAVCANAGTHSRTWILLSTLRLMVRAAPPLPPCYACARLTRTHPPNT